MSLKEKINAKTKQFHDFLVNPKVVRFCIRFTIFFFPLMIFFTNMSITIVVFFGGRLTIGGQITPGDFVAFISYLNMLMWPMMALGWLTNLIQRGSASLDRINNILSAEPEIRDTSDAKPQIGRAHV